MGEILKLPDGPEASQPSHPSGMTAGPWELSNGRGRQPSSRSSPWASAERPRPGSPYLMPVHGGQQRWGSAALLPAEGSQPPWDAPHPLRALSWPGSALGSRRRRPAGSLACRSPESSGGGLPRQHWPVFPRGLPLASSGQRVPHDLPSLSVQGRAQGSCSWAAGPSGGLHQAGGKLRTS